MSALAVSLIFAACVFVGGLAGLSLSARLPEAHRSKETQDFVRLATGMLSLLASLVLGLLIATARTSFQTMDTSIRTYAAELIQLDETLRDYGESARPPRLLVRDYTQRLLARTWPQVGDIGTPFLIEDTVAGLMLEHVREGVRGLQAGSTGQGWLQTEGLSEISLIIGHRWRLIERAAPSVQQMVIGILGTWIVLIFVSFGINVPRNATVIATFAVSALAIGSSIFLVMELDSPFEGLLQVSSDPVKVALAHMLP